MPLRVAASSLLLLFDVFDWIASQILVFFFFHRPGDLLIFLIARLWRGRCRVQNFSLIRGDLFYDCMIVGGPMGVILIVPHARS